MNKDANFRRSSFDLQRTRNSGLPAGPNLAWAGYMGGAVFGDDRSGRLDDRDMVIPRIARTIDNAGILLVTALLISLRPGSLYSGHSLTNAVADVVAVLVYFLAARRPRLEHVHTFKSFLEQFRFFLPSVVVAGFAQALIAWWLGANLAIIFQGASSWVMAATCAFVVTRSTTLFVLRQDIVSRRLRRKVAIIGHDRHAAILASRLHDSPCSNVEIIGIFSDRQASSDVTLNGNIEDLLRVCQDINLYGIIVALPPSPAVGDELHQLGLRLRKILTDVFVLPYLLQGPDIVLPSQQLGQNTLMVMQRRPLDGWQQVYKRSVDLAFSLAAFVIFFAPMLFIIGVLIKLDSPGPVFFRQPRRGLNNKTFMVFKFRTMHMADTDLASVKQTSRNDPRVTRLGKWLRRLSIDELPQLINVIRGEMSLVGPRPHALKTMVEGELLDKALADYLLRYQVKPGITGWAQVNGARGELVTCEDLRRRLTYDLEYIQRWSVRFDLKIIFLTAVKEIFSKHAF